MTISTIPSFDGGQNLNPGNRNKSDATLEELLDQIKTDVEAIEDSEQHGRETAGGAGDVTITLPTAYADTNYTIQVSGEDTGSGNPAPYVKNDASDKTASQFVVTVAAAGVVNWNTKHD